MIPSPLICTSSHCDHTWNFYILDGFPNAVIYCPECTAELSRKFAGEEAEEREADRWASIRAGEAGKAQYYAEKYGD